MTSFQLCSDLHIELKGGLRASAERYPERYAPILVIAGDLYPAAAPEFKEILRRAAEPYELTLFVPGNHDFYGSVGDMRSLERTIADKVNSLDRVFSLNLKSLHVGDMLFVGATLWTNPPEEDWAFLRDSFNDYTSIEKRRGVLYDVRDICETHLRHARFLKTTIAAEKRRRRGKSSSSTHAVVVTHHAPDMRLASSICKKPANLCPLYFASDMRPLTDDSFIKVWAFGHTHESHCVQLKKNGTIFATNAMGYPGEKTGYSERGCMNIGF
jgi:DNA repair exonuclease SbcCD nuclease subunit